MRNANLRELPRRAPALYSVTPPRRKIRRHPWPRRLLALLTILLWLAVVVGIAITWLIFFVAGPPMRAIAGDAPRMVRHELTVHRATFVPLGQMGVWLPRAT